MIPKLIEARPGESWVNVVEYPDNTLCLEGIREHPDELGTFIVNRIRFSPNAVRALIPLMQDWIEGKEEEPF